MIEVVFRNSYFLNRILLEIREFKLSYLISWMEEEFLHKNEFCNIESSHNTSWIGYRILARSIKMSHDCNSFSFFLSLSPSLYTLFLLYFDDWRFGNWTWFNCKIPIILKIESIHILSGAIFEVFVIYFLKLSYLCQFSFYTCWTLQKVNCVIMISRYSYDDFDQYFLNIAHSNISVFH